MCGILTPYACESRDEHLNRITIVGVGLHKDQLTLGATEALRAAPEIVLRTGRCGAAGWLTEQGIAFETLDHLYEQADDFDTLSAAIAQEVARLAEDAPVCYCVHELRDQSVRLLMQAHEKSIDLVPGVAIDAPLGALLEGPCACLATADIEAYQPEAACAALVREIDSRCAAGELKLRLMERYPDELPITLLTPDGRRKRIALHELDQQRDACYDHRTAAYIPAVRDVTRLQRFGFDELNRIMRRLRAPDGCPWDKAQTHQSLTPNVVEEAYEVVDAINKGDIDGLYDELGDLLLQVTLHAEIARQHGEFAIDDVTSAVCAKMISRHVHIFGGMKADTPEQALGLWEQQKKKEKSLSTISDTMRAVTASLPQLMRAAKVQKKAASVGFDWDDPAPALDKVFEEADELRQAMVSGAGIEEELGDLLFAAVNVARLLKLEPELALGRAVDKFVARFERMEALIAYEDRRMQGMSLAEMDEYWVRIKKTC